MVEDSSNKFIK